MRVHSPLVGVCDPSLICRHWNPFEPPVGSAPPQVEVQFVHSLGSIHTPVQLEH